MLSTLHEVHLSLTDVAESLGIFLGLNGKGGHCDS